MRANVKTACQDAPRFLLDDIVFKLCTYKKNPLDIFAIIEVGAEPEHSAQMEKINDYLMNETIIRCKEDAMRKKSVLSSQLKSVFLNTMDFTDMSTPIVREDAMFFNLNMGAKYYLQQPPNVKDTVAVYKEIAKEEIYKHYLGAFRGSLILDLSHVKIRSDLKLNLKAGTVVSQVKIKEKLTGVPDQNLFELAATLGMDRVSANRIGSVVGIGVWMKMRMMKKTKNMYVGLLKRREANVVERH